MRKSNEDRFEEASNVEWTEQQLAVLKELYPHMLAKKIAEIVGRSATAVRLKGLDLKLQKIDAPWEQDEVQYLKTSFGKSSIGLIAHSIGRTKQAVSEKLLDLSFYYLTLPG